MDKKGGLIMDYELFLPSEIIVDNDYFSIHTTPNLESFSKEIFKYICEKRAIEDITKYYQNKDKGKSRRLDEFDDVPKGLSFKEFNDYLNRPKKIKREAYNMKN